MSTSHSSVKILREVGTNLARNTGRDDNQVSALEGLVEAVVILGVAFNTAGCSNVAVGSMSR